MSTDQNDDQSPHSKPTPPLPSGQTPVSGNSVPASQDAKSTAHKPPSNNSPRVDETLPEDAFDDVAAADVGQTMLSDEAESFDVPGANVTTILEDVNVNPDQTLPEDAFGEQAVEDIAEKTMLSDPGDEADDGVDFDNTLPEGALVATIDEDFADKTMQSDAGGMAGDEIDFDKTPPAEALAEDADEDFADKTMQSDPGDMTDDEVDFDKTLPAGALAETADEDFADKTMQSDPDDMAGDEVDFDKTLPVGALAEVADDDFAGKTMLVDPFDDGRSDESHEGPQEDFGKTMLDEDLTAAPKPKVVSKAKAAPKLGTITDVPYDEKTMVGDDVSQAAAPVFSADKTVGLGVSKDPMKTSANGTDPGPVPAKSASVPAESLNVALRSLGGLQHGRVTSKSDYRLVKQLGEGGMGVVYVARQQSLGREVVLKSLKPMPSTQADKLKSMGTFDKVIKHRTDMFVSEAVVTADLFHPNIVPIYDMGTANDGSLFYAMKWVRGVPWNKRLPELSLEENIDILLKVADGIAFAHARHVINRDLKPENVMIGEFGEVAVLDWGLALPFGEGKGRLPLAVTAGLGSGTPAYMAPELILGPLGKMGPPCDIYLLGAMLFEAVTGKPPHDFDTATQKGTQSAAKKMNEIRRVVCENVIRETEHKGELIDIAMKAMATKPADRYPTVVEFQQAIREYEQHAASRNLEGRARELIVTAVPANAVATNTKTSAGKLPVAQEGPTYASYQNALTLFTESLREWTGNQSAREGLTETQLGLGQLALNKGDFDLGLSVLDTNAESHSETRTLLLQAKEERESRVRRMKLLKIAAGAMALGLVVFLAVAARLQFNLTAALAKAAEAVVKAEQEQTKATAAQAKAIEEQKKADIAVAKAEAEKEKAAAAIVEAEQADKRAKEAAELAMLADVKAKAADEKAKVADGKAKEAVAAAEQADLAKVKANKDKAEAEAIAKLAKQQADLAEEQAKSARYLAGLAAANRFVQEGRYSDARLKLEDLKKNYSDKCKAEWDQLWSTVTAPQAVSMMKPVEAISVSRDGRLLVAADSAGSLVVMLVNAQGHVEDQQSRRFAFEGRPRTVAMAPNGSAIAAAGEDGLIRVWTLANEADPIVLKGHDKSVNTVMFSEDGKRLASGGDDRTVRLWSLDGARELAQQKVLYPVQAVAWSRDEATLVAGTSNADEAAGVAYSWEVVKVEAGLDIKPLRTFQVPPEGKVKQGRGMVTIALTHDGQYAVVNGAAAEIHLFRTDLRKAGLAKKSLTVNVASLKVGLHSKRVERVRSLAFNADSTQLFAAGDDGTISIWKRQETDALPTFERTIVLYGHGGPVRSCFPLPQSPELLVSGSYDQFLHVWNLQTYQKSREWLDQPMTEGAQKTSLHSNPQRSRGRTFPDVLTTHSSVSVSSASGTSASQPRETRPLVGESGYLEEAPRTSSSQSRVSFVSYQIPESDAQKKTPPAEPVKPVATKVATEKRPSVQIVTGHTDAVLSAVFSRDGRRVLSSSRDQTARVWDSLTGERVGSASGKSIEFDDNVFLEGHEYDLLTMKFFPDGNTLLTSGFDGTMRIWDSRVGPSAGRELAMLPETGMYGVVDISRDGQWILTAGRSTADNKLVAGAKKPNWHTAQLWNTAGVLVSRRPRPEIILDGQHHYRVTSVAISPNNKRLLSADREGYLVVWDAETGKVIGRQRNMHVGEIVKMEFLGDGSRMLSAGVDRRVVLWNVTETTSGVSFQRDRQYEHDGMIVNLAVSPRGDRFFTVSRRAQKKSKVDVKDQGATTKLTLWDLETRRAQAIDLAMGAAAGSVKDQGRVPVPAWSADGVQAVITTTDGTLHFFDSNTAKITRSLTVDNSENTAERAQPFAAILRPDEMEPLHVVTQTHNAANLWRLQDGANLASFRPQGPVFSAGYSADGRFAVTGGRSLRVFDADENSPTYGRNLHKVEYPHLGMVMNAEFSPIKGSLHFVSASYDGTAKVWEWQPEQQTARLVHELKDHVGPVRFGTWSVDGSKILTVGHDARPRVWTIKPDAEPTSVTLDLPMPANDQGAKKDYDQLCGTFSNDGRFVAIGGKEAGTQESVGWVWNLAPAPNAAPQLHAEIRGHGLGGVNSVAFLPDDDRLLSGGSDGTARMWDWHREDQLAAGEPPIAADFLISFVQLGEATTHRGAVTCVRVARDGTIVTASTDGRVIIWPRTGAAKVPGI
ncbi:MAG: protein kinase [Planctomycetia bacterium]|nr:protein kinase [Planctomycetia bacterium]